MVEGPTARWRRWSRSKARRSEKQVVQEPQLSVMGGCVNCKATPLRCRLKQELFGPDLRFQFLEYFTGALEDRFVSLARLRLEIDADGSHQPPTYVVQGCGDVVAVRFFLDVGLSRLQGGKLIFVALLSQVLCFRSCDCHAGALARRGSGNFQTDNIRVLFHGGGHKLLSLCFS